MDHRPRQISMSLWLHQGLTENMCLGDWGVLPERGVEALAVVKWARVFKTR